jgi:outer membrane receptor protein involved in Fe transport
VNVDEAYLQGFEWEQTYGAGAWEGSLALSYTDTNGKNRDSSVAAMNFSEPLVDVPPAKAVASVSYNFGLWDDGDARVTWQTEAALKQTEVSQNAKDTLLVREAPAYAVHNLYLNWQAGDYGYAKDVRVGLAAENLLDTAYRRQASFFNEEGRNLLVTVSSKF